MIYLFSLNISFWIKALTIDCFYFSDQEVKMEEAMSHTGIHQFLFSLQWLFFFSLTPAWAETASFPLIPIHGVPALDLWLHAGDMLTNHNRWFWGFFSIKAASFVVSSVHTVCLHFHLLFNVSPQLLNTKPAYFHIFAWVQYLSQLPILKYRFKFDPFLYILFGHY